MTPRSASTRTSTPHIETITCYLKVCVDQFFVKQVSLDFPIDIAGYPHQHKLHWKRCVLSLSFGGLSLRTKQWFRYTLTKQRSTQITIFNGYAEQIFFNPSQGSRLSRKTVINCSIHGVWFVGTPYWSSTRTSCPAHWNPHLLIKGLRRRIHCEACSLDFPLVSVPVFDQTVGLQ